MHNVEKFLKYLQFEKRYSLHTITSYSTDLSQFQQFLSKEYKVNNVNDIHHKLIRSWISVILESGLSARSVNRKITTLKSFFRYLVLEGVLEENPTNKIVSPKNKPIIIIY